MTQMALGARRELRADRFHAGVRFLALLAWFGAIALVYGVLRLLLGALLGSVTGVGVVVVVVMAVFLAQPLAWLVEKKVVARWPSGRSAWLAPNCLTWRDKNQTLDFDLGQKLNFWRWRFEVKGRRGGRVPSGHHCFALRLVQGEVVLNLYSFLSPAQANAVSAQYPVYELRRSGDPAKLSLGGRDAIFLAAEHARWESGAELDAADFQELHDHLAAHVLEFKTGPTSGG